MIGRQDISRDSGCCIGHKCSIRSSHFSNCAKRPLILFSLFVKLSFVSARSPIQTSIFVEAPASSLSHSSTSMAKPSLFLLTISSSTMIVSCFSPNSSILLCLTSCLRDGRGPVQAISGPVQGIFGTTGHLCRTTKQIPVAAKDHVGVELMIIYEVKPGLRRGDDCIP